MATDFQVLPLWKRIGVIVAILGIVGTISSVLIPALSGNEHPPSAAGNSAAFGFLLWPYLLAYWMGWKRPWLYPIGGFAVFLLIAMVGGAARGMERRAKIQSTEEQLLTALEHFEPETGKAARSAEGDPAKMRALLLPAFARASQVASDAALLKSLDGSIAMIETPTGRNLPRCVATLMGTPQPKTTAVEVDATSGPMIAVFESASQNLGRTPPIDRKRAEEIRANLWEAADTQHVLSNSDALNALSDPEKCDLFLRYVHGLRALPEADAGLVLRNNVAPSEQ